MPRLKADEVDLGDIKELENAEYRRGPAADTSEYEGEDPPGKIILPGLVKKLFLTVDSNDNRMLKVLFEADEDEDGQYGGEFNGWVTWDNMSLTVNSKFRWQPFLDALGLTLRDISTKMYAEDDDIFFGETAATPITKVADVEIGSDDAYVRIVTKRESWTPKGESKKIWSTKVSEWMPFEPEDDDAPAASNGRTRKAAKAEPQRAVRSRKASKRSEEPEEEPVDEPEDETAEDEEVEETAPRRTGRARAATGTRGASGKRQRAEAAEDAPAPRRGRGRGRAADAGDTEEPPF